MLNKQAIQTPWKVTYTVSTTPFILDTQQHSPEVEIEISNLSTGDITVQDQAGATVDVILFSTSKTYKLVGGFFVQIAVKTINSGAGLSDHGLLVGLLDDDHPQYHNDTRGDTRYYTKSQTDTSLAGKADLVGGFVPTSQIPSIAISEFLGSVATQPAMLALSGQKGDWCIRTDENKTYIIKTGTGSVLSDWQALSTPTDLVLSVNGQTGTIVLGKADVGLANVDNTSDLNKPVSTATQTALNLKANDNTVMHLTGNETVEGDKTFSNPSATGEEILTVKSDTPTGIMRLWARGSLATAYGLISAGAKVLYSNKGMLGMFAEGVDRKIILSASGVENSDLEINDTGSATFRQAMTINGVDNKVNYRIIDSDLNVKSTRQSDGGGQRAVLDSMTAMKVDGSSMTFTTYVDGQTDVVGNDTYQIWGYPKNTSGTIIDFAPLLQLNYNRTNGSASLALSRAPNWDAYTPTVFGASGSGATINILSARFHRLGRNITFAIRAIVTNKGTCGGSFYIEAPTMPFNSQNTTVAGGIYPIGGSPSTSRGFASTNTEGATGSFVFTKASQSAVVQWSDIAVNDEINLSGVYEAVGAS